MRHHIPVDCHMSGLCAEKLATVHPDLKEIYVTKIKQKFQDSHISCGFRNQFDQNQAVAMGKSKLPWPLSAHNKEDDSGNEASLAIDLFRLASNNMACWEYKYFREIADYLVSLGVSMKFGLDFKTLGDSDHFQLIL